jgi:hypothetical protein
MGGSVTPIEITDHLLNNERTRIEQKHRDLSKKQKYNLAKKNAISLRAVKGHLKNLLRKKIATKSKGGVYSINDSADYRYFGQRFGRGALFLLMKEYGGGGGRIGTPQENTEELINIFGTLVLYCFLEACKLYELTDQKADDDRITTADKRIYSWVQDVLNPSDMFAHFLAIMDEGDVTEDSTTDEDDDYMYTSLSDKTIDDMLKITGKKFPEYYEALSTARERIRFEIKHGYLDRSSGKLAPGDPPYA